ncbi:MAG: hypothetical protein ACK5P7_00675 [Bdellovibrio sp.]|jgi:hypothetical protein
MAKTNLAKSNRMAPRKELTPVNVSSVSSLESLSKIARGGEVIEASTSGILLMIKREDLVPVVLRKNLNLDALIGDKILIHLPDLNLEIAGKVARTRFVGKEGFEIGIDYTDDAPEYWRECLVDLLPAPGEFD